MVCYAMIDCLWLCGGARRGIIGARNCHRRCDTASSRGATNLPATACDTKSLSLACATCEGAEAWEFAMTLAGVLFVLVIVCGLSTLGVMMVGVLSMGHDAVDGLDNQRRSNRLMVWRVRLQLLTVLLMPLWWLSSRG